MTNSAMTPNIKIVTTTAHEFMRRLSLLKTVWLTVLACAGTAVHAADGPPVFLQEPVSLSARQGESVQLSLQADGSLPLTITWLRNGLPVATGSTAIFSTAPLRAEDDGAVFSAMLSNAQGVAISSNVFLTIEPGIAVAASVNGAANVQLFRGWPLMLKVVL